MVVIEHLYIQTNLMVFFFLRTFFPAGVRSVGTGRQRRIGVVLYLFRGNQRGGALLINHRWTIFVFSNFLGLIWRGTHQVLQKKCTRVLLQNVVRMTKVIQKLGHHASTLCCVGGGNSEHGFFKLQWNLTIGQKGCKPNKTSWNIPLVP